MAAQSSFERPAETEINLHDIFWYILKNWIVLLICMVVFAALLGVYKRSSQTKAVAASEKAVAEYNALTDEEKAKIKATDVPVQIAAGTIASSFKKYLVLGAVLGVFLGAAGLAVYYVLNGYLANAPAIRSRYGLPTFGIVPSSKVKGLNRSILNKLTYRTYNMPKDEAVRLIAANLAMYLKGGDKVLLVGTMPLKKLESVKKALKEVISVPIETAGNVNNEADAVLALSAGNKVVCVERILGSKQTYVDFEMETLAASKAECIGFILME